MIKLYFIVLNISLTRVFKHITTGEHTKMGQAKVCTRQYVTKVTL